ncbi:hypothetical protein X975_00669, partial [Stegodyphus mimosarum]
MGNKCFLVTSVNGVTSHSEKKNEFSTNSSSTSHGNGSKINIYDNKCIKNTMYGNGLCDAGMYGNVLPSNLVYLEGSLNSAPVCSQADREVQTQSEEIPNNVIKTMYGNGLCDAGMYGNELPSNLVYLEGSLNSALVCSQADREVQTQSEEIPNNIYNDAYQAAGTPVYSASSSKLENNSCHDLQCDQHLYPSRFPSRGQSVTYEEAEIFSASPQVYDNHMENLTPLLGEPDMSTVNSPSEIQSNFAASPLGDFAMETFSEIRLPDSPNWEDFSDLLEIMEEENDDVALH